jgi:thioredoxin-like negative regulator of GroEL
LKNDSTVGDFLGDLMLQVFTHPACSGCGPVVERVWRLTEELDSVQMQTVKLETKEGLAHAQSVVIRTIPSVIIIEDGEEIQRFIGTPEQGLLEAAVEKALEE